MCVVQIRAHILRPKHVLKAGPTSDGTLCHHGHPVHVRAAPLRHAPPVQCQLLAREAVDHLHDHQIPSANLESGPVCVPVDGQYGPVAHGGRRYAEREGACARLLAELARAGAVFYLWGRIKRKYFLYHR